VSGSLCAGCANGENSAEGRQRKRANSLETETAVLAASVPKRRRERHGKVRGIYEKVSGSGIWWCRWADGAGKIHREKRGARGSAIAVYRKRKLAVLEGQLLPGKVRQAKMPTLAEFAQRFIDAISVECASKPQTVRFYAVQMAALLKFAPLAEARLCEIDEALIQAFIEHRARASSIATVNRGLATLRRALRLAQLWKVVDRVPRIRLVRGEHRREFILKREDEARYLAVCPPMLREIATLLVDTGLRVGEVLALEWRDVNLASTPGSLQVRNGKSFYARRVVPLTERAKALLANRRREAQSLFVFGERDGKPMRTTSAVHEHAKVRRKFGFPPEFVLHSLRHSFCTRLGEAGAEAFMIQRLAGHHSVTVSERYVHPTPEAAVLAIGRLEASNRAVLPVPTDTATSTRLLALP
jgi:integrase